MGVLFIIILAGLVLLSISIAEVYSHIPLIEIKRRARNGDKLSKSLYKVASYRFSSQFLLWLIASLASAAFFVIIVRKSPVWFSLTASLLLIWVAYIWIPRSSVNIVSIYFAQILSSPLSWLLHYIHPTLYSMRKKTTKKTKVKHTGLYENSDIIALLTKQKKQTDNRVADFELEMLKHILEFNQTTVSNITTFKRKVKAVEASENLSPIVLDELYKTGHLFFPVYDGKQSNIVGILNINDVVTNMTTPVTSSVMDRRISYVHEDQLLDELLLTIISTRQQFFIVINSSQEYVGIVTTKDALVALVGSEMSETFNQHDSKEAVAQHFAFHSQSEDENRPKDETEMLE